MAEPAWKIEPPAAPDVPASRTFTEWAHEHAAAVGSPAGERSDDPWLRSFAAMVETATPEELARERELLRIRREVYGGDILAECRAFRDGTHPLAAGRTKA